MPKAPMEKADFLKKKEEIIDIAAEIILEDGFQNLSMRKIGSKIGMTAANLYNYYSNKDELNIAIRTRAGQLLFVALKSAYQKGDAILDKIRYMAEAYLDFGLTSTNYYSILFDLKIPKYSDYIGSPLEPIALKEKESTEESFALLQQCIEELLAEGFKLPDSTEGFLALVWSQFHGLVSLYNNKLMTEVLSNPEQIIKDAATIGLELLFRTISPPETIME